MTSHRASRLLLLVSAVSIMGIAALPGRADARSSTEAFVRSPSVAAVRSVGTVLPLTSGAREDVDEMADGAASIDAVSYLNDVSTGATVQRVVQAATVTPYEVVASYPHDPTAFLQGLVWYDGGFYESTGLYGQSTLRRVAFPSGEVLQEAPLAHDLFGEGLALVGDRLVQLTWRSKQGFIYDRDSFSLLGSFHYDTEGWGLTYDGTSLIMSDGTDTLTFLDPESYLPVRTLSVTLDGRPLRELNELEWIDGEVWANVWRTDTIVRIDPATGQVTSTLDMTGLLPADQRGSEEDVLNGIAYDPDTGRIFVSGKDWPLLFEIRLQ